MVLTTFVVTNWTKIPEVRQNFFERPRVDGIRPLDVHVNKSSNHSVEKRRAGMITPR